MPEADDLSRPSEVVEVVAGVLRDGDGRVLLARRLEGKHLAGTWEFPGGKREPNESARAALARELDEELGVRVVDARPWLSLTHHYPEIRIRLRLFEVDGWHGEVRGREGQPVKWLAPGDMDHETMPAADRPIVKALSLDARYAITPDPGDIGGTDALLEWTKHCIARGMRLIQLRAKSLDDRSLADLAVEFSRLVRRHDATWLLNGPPEIATAAGADGIHLDAARLMAAPTRPLPADRLVAASCHDERELRQAGDLGLDFVTLSPVRSTPSHADAVAVGWDGFERLSRLSPLPVYALGGIAPDDLERSRKLGGFGVAGISAFGDSS